MKILCKALLGSRGYGLHSDSSDYDERGAFLSESIGDIFGLTKKEHEHIEEDGTDIKFTELRRFFGLLKKGNSEAIEILFNENWIQLDPLFKSYVIDYRHLLLDPVSIHKNLKGYSFGERNLAFGITTGRLGEKRKKDVELYGYSPKNVVNLIRLLYCGVTFFESGIYPVDIRESNPSLAYCLKEIKNNPEAWPKKRVEQFISDSQKDFDSVSSKIGGFRYDESYIEQVCLQFYRPEIEKSYASLMAYPGKP